MKPVTPRTTKIPLTQGKFAIVDEADFARVAEYQWYAHREGRTFYAYANIRRSDGSRTIIKMHRLLHPEWTEVDHCDGNGANNTQVNMRRATHSENLRNSRKQQGTSSSFKGVYLDKRRSKWHARITLSGGRHADLGHHASEEEAARAYDKAAVELFGESACLNFPPDGKRGCRGA